MVKLSIPKLKIVWHDHYGRNLNKRRKKILRIASRFFEGIITVNAALKEWAEKNLNSKEVRFFRNFLPDAQNRVPVQLSSLKGQQDSFKILCLANLRPQKDHLNLLKAFETIEKVYSQASLHLVGKDKEDNYSIELKTFVRRTHLEEKVFFYGETQNVKELLLQADLGVLSSASEGLPLALLEYGRAGLPVVCTTVGECPEVLGKEGLLVPPADPKVLSEAILHYIDHTGKRKEAAENLQKKILEEYSERTIFPEVENFFRILLQE
nr:glycosyltransferase [Salinimicrobium sp. HB62]